MTKAQAPALRSYTDCERFLDGAAERKLCHNTVCLRLPDGSFGVQLHNTVVVKYHTDGNIQLNHGGYKTATTRDRLNRFSPAQVFQVESQWKIRTEPTYPAPNVAAWNWPEDTNTFWLGADRREAVKLATIEGIARLSGTDIHGIEWIQFEVDHFAQQETGICDICGKPLDSGWLCLDSAGYEICDSHVIRPHGKEC